MPFLHFHFLSVCWIQDWSFSISWMNICGTSYLHISWTPITSKRQKRTIRAHWSWRWCRNHTERSLTFPFGVLAGWETPAITSDEPASLKLALLVRKNIYDRCYPLDAFSLCLYYSRNPSLSPNLWKDIAHTWFAKHHTRKTTRRRRLELADKRPATENKHIFANDLPFKRRVHNFYFNFFPAGNSFPSHLGCSGSHSWRRRVKVVSRGALKLKFPSLVLRRKFNPPTVQWNASRVPACGLPKRSKLVHQSLKCHQVFGRRTSFSQCHLPT